MAICNSCGGVLGRDCFNPEECAWIAHQQEQAQRQQAESLEQRLEKLERRVAAIEEARP